MASEVGISQSHVARIELGQVPDISLHLASRVLEAVGGRLNASFMAAAAPSRPQHDAAHARCVAYVARRLEAAGFLAATEVEVAGARWTGFVDVLAFHPLERVLLVIEVKTEIHDIGEIDRQLGVAERGAWDAAHPRGWRPRALTGVLLALASDENDRRLTENRGYVDRAFRVRSRDLQQIVEGRSTVPRRGERGLAMIDPATRRRQWLMATTIDGRRTPARYADRAAFLRARR